MKLPFLLTSCLFVTVASRQDWQTRDSLDDIRLKMDKITAFNCEEQQLEDLFLPEDTVSHLPDVREIYINPVFPNRTALLHLNNLALSRSFFWSYVLQSRLIRPETNETHDPGMMYHLLSSAADVSADSYASGTYFAPNMAYSPSYQDFFNKTFARFAPRTFRTEVQADGTLIRNAFIVSDLGAFPAENPSLDYTADDYRINEWYKKWLPDRPTNRFDTKTAYMVDIRYANNTNKTFVFYGPPGADDIPGPVEWTRPYFDCQRSNRWLVAAVVPIVDVYPRHSVSRDNEYPLYTGVSVVEMSFEKIDINQCPTGTGNLGPNKFADTARCKTDTTECEPLHGWGFQRGGYQCRCKPGWRLPSAVERPFLGETLEEATLEEYQTNFNCSKINSLEPLPFTWDKAPLNVRENYLDQFPEYKSQYSGPASLQQEKLNVDHVMKFILSVNERTCDKYTKEQLTLREDFAFGADEFFVNEARMATRLSNFISAFLQVSDPMEVYTDGRVADRPLTEDQIIAEALAVVMGSNEIWSAGVYWGRNKFTGRTLFAPYAYKRELNTRRFRVEDLARVDSPDDVYTNQPWFTTLQQKWTTDFDELEKYFLKIHVRNNETGEGSKKYEHYPTFYRAANVSHGQWTAPYFDCDGKVKKWLITYASPFFGWDNVKVKLEFKGVVVVTMDLLKLDMNQCDNDVSGENAFKGTHKCDRNTTYCVPIQGRGFDTGGYKCECKQGFEYPFEVEIGYYDGQLVEGEFNNMINDKATRYDTWKCRNVPGFVRS